MAATLPSCWRLGFWDLPYIQCGNSGVCLKDALAPPLYPLKPRKSQTAALRQRPALEALHKENTGGLDYLRKQEKRGRDRERKPRRKASCKKADTVKLCVMLTSFLVAPKAIGWFLKPKPGWDGRRMDQATILYRRKYKDRALQDPLIVAW